jgi:surfactin synthase thioesterase subunit
MSIENKTSFVISNDKTDKLFPFGVKGFSKNKMKVFCFNHAGGSASSFVKWFNSNYGVDFIPVEMPGRGRRLGEYCVEDIGLIADEMAYVINKNTTDISFAFFGHSLGAIVAFKTACLMKEYFGKTPVKLIIAGREAPHMKIVSKFRTSMGVNALIEELRRNCATPEDILNNKEAIDFFAPIFMSDYKMDENFRYCGEKLNIPITAHSGSMDHDADKKIMEKWSEVTDNLFRIKEFDGKHFFVHDMGEEYIEEVVREVLG